MSQRALVAEGDAGTKLGAFLRDRFKAKVGSRRAARRALEQGLVSINGVVKCVDDDSVRLCPPDEVCLADPLPLQDGRPNMLRKPRNPVEIVQRWGEPVAGGAEESSLPPAPALPVWVAFKPAGANTASGRDYEECLRATEGIGGAEAAPCQLYLLEKQMAGLVPVAQAWSNFNHFVAAQGASKAEGGECQSDEWAVAEGVPCSITLRAIVCGEVPPAGITVACVTPGRQRSVAPKSKLLSSDGDDDDDDGDGDGDDDDEQKERREKKTTTRTKKTGGGEEDEEEDDDADIHGEPGASGGSATTAGAEPPLVTHFSLTPISVTPSKSARFLTLVDIRPLRLRQQSGTTDGGHASHANSSSTPDLLIPPHGFDRRLFRHLFQSLREEGWPVVGDRGIVRRDKGIYAAVTRCTVGGAPGALGSGTAEGEQPTKFNTLLAREEGAAKAAAEQIAQTVAAAAADAAGAGAGASGGGSSAGVADDGVSVAGGSDSDAALTAQAALKASLASGMPAAYITGQATFLGRAFNVSQAVMIPRLSSQTLVHAAVRWHHRKGAAQGCRVLDLGTGSGCLLLSALKELSASISPIPAQTLQPQTVVGVGIDLSSEALEVARSNAERLDLVPQVHFLEASFGDLATVADLSSRLLQEGGCSAEGSESTAVPFAGFDVIVCNPPYSSESEVDRIDWQPRAFEPHLAIFTARGTGKLSAYKAIAESMACCFESAGEASPRILCPGGVLVVEVGNGQADAVTAIFCDGPWGVFQLEEACKDLHGLVRALVFRQTKCNAT